MAKMTAEQALEVWDRVHLMVGFGATDFPWHGPEDADAVDALVFEITGWNGKEIDAEIARRFRCSWQYAE